MHFILCSYLVRIIGKNGGKLVIINKGGTALDNIADIRIWSGASDTLKKVMK